MNKFVIKLLAVVGILFLSACNQQDNNKPVDTKGWSIKEIPAGESSASHSARYQMIPAYANHAWKIDTQEGVVWFCSAEAGEVICVEATPQETLNDRDMARKILEERKNKK
jgi:hypothetical protein